MTSQKYLPDQSLKLNSSLCSSDEMFYVYVSCKGGRKGSFIVKMGLCKVCEKTLC